MTVQNSSVLLSEGPGQLLEHSLAEYADFLETGEGLRREHLETVDFALLHTLERLLRRSSSEAELESAYEELRGMVPPERKQEWSDWAPRWRAFADLVDARISALRARAEGAEDALRLAHADRILALIRAEPGLIQSEIAEKLELKPANLSRILGVLEAHELLERRTIGREKRVHPGRFLEEVTVTGYPSSEADAVDSEAALSVAQPEARPYGAPNLPEPYQGLQAQFDRGITVFAGGLRAA